MADIWPPATLPGLHIDLGDYHHRGVWLRLPTAVFTCSHGCRKRAVGVDDVRAFTKDVAEIHARTCPGPTTTP
ncbi:hypothetical protein DF268_35895 [Streptomyces sp. V2]|uniref:hypothetical protein n=1 Tax=Streptomyces sp. V2 TaxID=1424099 RepID=UPI000D66AEA0|nr:hypothetical protein [Streptomyces sp. V2]PWG08757.1 hypothetical protein DF268_35895 [Streptomyces sp. V2]